jgi:glycyl-tRNA synthetase beta chain
VEATLLVELLTEELPPKSLRGLGQEFALGILDGLAARRLIPQGVDCQPLCTPRRLAVLVPKVLDIAPDHTEEAAGPSVQASPQAVSGFARKHGVAPEALARRDTPKGQVFVAIVQSKGASLDTALADIVSEAIRRLPVPRLMRWGAGEAQFVRPVHGLVLLHGERLVPGKVLGLESRNRTRGHRFLCPGEIEIANAHEYEVRLRDAGRVIADFAARRAEIARLLAAEARRHGAVLGEHQALLDEVTALVEWPSVYAGGFEAKYLEVPQECLVLTMRQNQKYFPLFDAGGKLLPKFLIVSNMSAADPLHIVRGNERVVRPRLEDARFFYHQDRKVRLEQRVPQLAKVIYHHRLGSQLERVERIRLLAGHIARELGADAALAERAAWLSKADLLTGMVGEFPELQGTMGRYYARHDGEPAAVAEAIEAHYLPRFAGDRLPEGRVACAVALADKLDALAGLFSAGEISTGEKDPFGLRRAALGVIRIVLESQLSFPRSDLLEEAFEPFQGKKQAELRRFIRDRLVSYLKERGFPTLAIDAVLGEDPVLDGTVPKRVEAVKAFQELPEADSLAAANKRVANILRQAQARGESFTETQSSKLKEPAERALQAAIRAASEKANTLYEQGDYAGYLKTFSVLKEPVDAFFDSVMVMVEDDALRRNRLALLADLREAMNRVADISKLAA